MKTDRSNFLRFTLEIDGVASALTGVILALGAGAVSPLLGIAAPGVVRTVGVLLVLYGAALVWNATRPVVSAGQALAAVGLNAAWVVGSIALIAAGELTALGNLMVAALAAAVLAFAMLQTIGLRKTRAA